MVNNRSIPLKIYLTPEENQELQARADAAQLSRSHYGRAVLFSLNRSSLSSQPLASQQRSLQKSNQALLLQLGQHYLLLSILQSDMAAWVKTIESDPLFHPHPILDHLQPLQAQLTVIQQVIQELAEHLHRQQAS